MTKYHCTCGLPFKKEEEGSLHLKTVTILNDGKYHHVYKKTLFERIYDYCSRHNIGRLIGGMTLYIVLTNHFKIEFSVWEGCFIGAGIALLLD